MNHRSADIIRYLEFNTWAMLKTLESVEQLSAEELRRDMQTSHSSVWGTLEHTYKADALWLKRLQGEDWPKIDDVAADPCPARAGDRSAQGGFPALSVSRVASLPVFAYLEGHGSTFLPRR